MICGRVGEIRHVVSIAHKKRHYNGGGLKNVKKPGDAEAVTASAAQERLTFIRENSIRLQTTNTIRMSPLAVVNEQLILVKHDGMMLGKVGHATVHKNWSSVRNMRHLTEIPNNTPSVSARRSEKNASTYRKSTSCPLTEQV